ncbi:ABC transporter permease subunit [Ensifer sp. ENS06]|uniref:ABC transporter permease n=1 Tax=Ensifer sp. ENS06 TaxID=2769276 RepID=UPI000DDE27FF|nr:ABC transporter permease subunit [Ensifer sp. ENS06]MBD9624679.1 ABC transporter permease subunit [Ensifer sp. ENS06]
MELLGGFGFQLLEGAVLTLKLAFASLALGLPLGLAMAMGKLSKASVVRLPTTAATSVLRALPELLVILIIYFGIQNALNALSETPYDIDPFAAGVASLGLIFAAYASEIFRASYIAVPRGQREAATSLGLSPLTMFWLVQLPQMWRFAVPSLGNLWLVMLKDTSLVAVIGLQELMRKAQAATATTKQAFLFYSVAALLYILMSIASALVIRYLNRRSQAGWASSWAAA